MVHSPVVQWSLSFMYSANHSHFISGCFSLFVYISFFCSLLIVHSHIMTWLLLLTFSSMYSANYSHVISLLLFFVCLHLFSLYGLFVVYSRLALRFPPCTPPAITILFPTRPVRSAGARSTMAQQGNVQVAVRCRPFSARGR